MSSTPIDPHAARLSAEAAPPCDAGASALHGAGPRALPRGGMASGAGSAPLSDADLVERAKTDPEAFGVLYERHAHAVFAFVLSKLRERAQAEDVTSQTFLQALRALPRYQERGVPIRSWLFRIAANLVTDLHRTPTVVQPLQVWQQGQSLVASARADAEGTGVEATAFDPPDPRAEAEIAAWEGAEDFLRLIVDLTAEQRAVLQLRFAEGLSIAEVAQRMERSQGAVKMLLMRGLQQLRRRWGQEAGND